MKKMLFILVINIISGNSYAQQNWAKEFEMHSQFIKTPEATMLERFQNYPVSNCLGIPDINIPIYEILSGDLKLPITLSYHLGGHKVNDIATWVGLGWNLNVGGMVSREIKGIDDENKSSGFLNSPSLSLKTYSGERIQVKVPIREEEFHQLNDYDAEGFGDIRFYLSNIVNESYDQGSDIYNYNIGNISGSFVYDMDRDLTHVPYSNNKIERDLTNNTFEITSPDGTIYKFSEKEETFLPWKKVSSGLRAVTNWKISSIVSPNHSNSIQFTYGGAVSYRVDRRTGTLSVGFDENGNGNQANGLSYNNTYTEFSEKYLKKIDFETGSIEFILNTLTRKDKQGHHGLNAIVVKDKQGAEIKRVTFNYSYFESLASPEEDTDYRLKLESIEISGSAGSIPLKYKFQYNENTRLPSRYSSQGSNASFGQDHWGYYNGVTNNNHLVDKISQSDIAQYSYLGNQKANRTPSELHMKAWVLERVDYPTGGFTEFITESNRDKDNKVVGGLRIKKMTSRTDASSTPVITTYQYETPRYIKMINDNEDYELYKYRKYIGREGGEQFTNQARYYYTEEPFSGLFFYQGSPLYYKKVIKTEEGNGKSVSTYTDPYIYRQVISANSGIGETLPTPLYPFIENLQSWVMGKLEMDEFYKENDSNPFKTVKYNYTVDPRKRITLGKHVFDRYVFNGNLPGPNLHAGGLFDYFWEEYQTGFLKLTETIETENGVTTRTQYNYEKVNSAATNNIQLTAKDETVNEKVINHKYKYPQDFTDAVSKEMVINNMVDVLLEHATQTGDTHISTRKRTFDKFGNFIQPSSEQSKKGPGIFKTDITYDVYDKRGFLNQFTTSGDLSTLILWSYYGQYPIAEIQNATYTEVETAVKAAFGVASIDALADLNFRDNERDVLISKLNAFRNHQALNKAQVMTYTYKPLVGMTSKTEPNGAITYYEYDSFGRLKQAKDTNGKIIEQYDYHYKP